MDQYKELIRDFEERAYAPSSPPGDLGIDPSLAGMGEATTPHRVPKKKYTALERITGAMHQYSPIMGGQRIYARAVAPPPRYLKEGPISIEDGLLDGIPEDKHPLVLGQLNQEQAERKRDELLQEQEYMNAIADGGIVSQIALPVAVSIFDPLSIPLGIGALSAVKSIGNATKVSRLTRAAGQYGVMGAAVGAEEAISMYDRDLRDTDDIFYGTVMGGFFGPVLGRFGGATDDIAKHLASETPRVSENMLKALDDRVLNAAKTDPTDINLSSITDITGRHIAERIDKDATFAKTLTEFLKKQKITGLAENVSNKKKAIAAHAADLDAVGKLPSIQDVNAIGKALKLNPLQTDALRLLGSKSPVLRMFSAYLLENASNLGGRQITETAALFKHREVTKLLTKAIKDGHSKGMQEWMDARKVPKLKRMYQTAQYNKELRLEMNHRNLHGVPLSTDPAITRAANQLDMANRDLIHLYKATGVTGADKVTFKYGHIPMVMDPHAIARLAREQGSAAELEKAMAIGYKNAGLDEHSAQRAASAVVQRSLRGQMRTDIHPDSLFTRDKRGDFEVLLSEAGVSKKDIDGMLKQLDEFDDGVARGHLKQRVPIDLSVQVGNKQLIDFVNNDVANLVSRMHQEGAGRAALASKGLRDIEDIRDVIDTGLAQAAALGEDITKLRGSAEGVIDQMLARPVGGGVSPVVRRLMDYTMVSRLAGIAFAQIAELQNIAGEYSLLGMLKAIPMAAQGRSALRHAAKTGDYSKVPPVIRETQAWAGDLWQEELLFKQGVILDEAPLSSGGWKMADDALAIAKDKLGTWSGLYAIRAMQNMAITQLMADKVTKLMTGKNISKAQLSRLESIGISGDALTRIQAQMKHVDTKRGTVNRLNLGEWDAVAREDYLNALHRHTAQLIQKGLAGESSYWLHKDVAALLLQFRSFPMLAIEKQTGRNLLHMDSTTAMVAMYGSAFSLAASMTKVYVTSIGMPDRDEYIERNLAPGRLAVHAVNYGSFFSGLGDALGTVGVAGGRGGLGDTVPTLSTITDVLNVPFRLALDGVSPKLVQNSAAALPLGSLPQARILANMASRLAE